MCFWFGFTWVWLFGTTEVKQYNMNYNRWLILNSGSVFIGSYCMNKKKNLLLTVPKTKRETFVALGFICGLLQGAVIKILSSALSNFMLYIPYSWTMSCEWFNRPETCTSSSFQKSIRWTNNWFKIIGLQSLIGCTHYTPRVCVQVGG